ncbi:MAG: type II CAAX prenyl endopeptidase Rce1 family protein [Actinomycetota bacterium]|nr:CPBP family intramembrane metalloprotease [Actinomycetota bacterium]
MSTQPPVAMRLCPNCGHPCVVTDRFCVSCGLALPEPSPNEVIAAPDETQKVPWRAWEALIVFLIQLVISAGFAAAAVFTLKRDAAIVVSAMISEIVLLMTVIVWVRVRYGSGLRDLGFRSRDRISDVGWGIGAGLLGLMLQFVLLPLVLYFGHEVTGHPVKTPKQVPLDHPSGALLVLLGITVIVLAPLAEEVFFRGFLFQAWRKWMSPFAAAVASAAVFALAHVSPILYVPIGALGYVLARIFMRRDSLLPNVVAHGLFNTIGFIFIVLSFR